MFTSTTLLQHCKSTKALLNMPSKSFTSLIIALLALTHTIAFQLPPTTTCTLPSRRPLTGLNADKLPPSEELQDLDGIGQISSDSIDWDAEWKKVMESKDQAKRPNPYKSQIEIEAIKATNKALKVGKDVTNKVAKNVFDSKSEMGRFGGGGMRSLQGDWRVSEVRRFIVMHALL
jgi:hypothetical protein